jgi:predicted RNase H-like HicB family nuclease
MKHSLALTLDYWEDDGWFVGQLREVPSVLSQGKTLEDLQENILDAYEQVVEASRSRSVHPGSRSKLIPICVPA